MTDSIPPLPTMPELVESQRLKIRDLEEALFARDTAILARDQVMNDPSAPYVEMLEGKCTAFAREIERLRSDLKHADTIGAIQEMANALKPLADWAKETRSAILEAGGCDECGERLPAVVMKGDEQLGLLHFIDGESAECENSVLQEMHRRGCLNVEVYEKCPAGHDWFGSGCPECNPEEVE